MSRYRRAKIEGGTFFFTVTLADRSSDNLIRHVDRLRSAYVSALKTIPVQNDRDLCFAGSPARYLVPARGRRGLPFALEPYQGRVFAWIARECKPDPEQDVPAREGNLAASFWGTHDPRRR